MNSKWITIEDYDDIKTRAMDVGTGIVLRVTTYWEHTRAVALGETMTFVPSAKIIQHQDGSYYVGVK